MHISYSYNVIHRFGILNWAMRYGHVTHYYGLSDPLEAWLIKMNIFMVATVPHKYIMCSTSIITFHVQDINISRIFNDAEFLSYKV